MNVIKNNDVVICVNQNDCHYMKIGIISDIEHDVDYPNIIKT